MLKAQIKNASFEENKVSGERQIVKKLKGWSVASCSVELITTHVFSAAEGNQVLDLNGNEPGRIGQTVKGLKRNTDYTLKFETSC